MHSIKVTLLILCLSAFAACSDIEIVNVGSELSCTDDTDCVSALDCEVGVCNKAKGTCNFTVVEDRCLIDSVCYNEGQEQPSAPCKVCQPALEQYAFVNKLCGEGQSCNTDDGECVSSGTEVCGDGVLAEIEGCDDGNAQAGDGCSDLCAVEDGYTCAEAGVACTDIDECAAPTAPCDTNATCTNAPGTYACACNAGYEGDGTTCTDIDECAASPCGANEVCANTDAAYACTCADGFERDADDNCVDIDECAAATSPCADGEVCTNTEGSFSCAPPGLVSITFSVDMSCSGLASFATVAISGPFSQWCGGCHPLTDPDGDNIWTGTFEFADGEVIEYKYIVDNFEGQENLLDDVADGGDCAPITDNSGYANREATASAGLVIEETFGTCADCATVCNPGYQVGAEGACVDVDECAATPSPCGENTVCTNSDGSYTCECAPGFTSVDDVCTEIVCEEASCGDHANCGPAGACECVAGYTDQGQGCVWTGVLVNPSFDSSDAWTELGNAGLVPNVEIGNGAAKFPAECDWAGISQTVTMPAYGDAEPLIAQIKLTPNKGACAGSDCLSVPLMLGVNGQVSNLQSDHLGSSETPKQTSSGATVTAAVCLGAAGYGGAVDFTFFNASPSVSTCAAASEFATWSIESVEIIADTQGVCGVHGSIGNADFEAGNDGSWSLNASSGNAQADISGGTLNLSASTLCKSADAEQTVMFPAGTNDAGEGLALKFNSKGSPNKELVVTFGSYSVRGIMGTGSNTMAETVVCVPPDLRGTTSSLGFVVNAGSGTCKTVVDHSFEIDDISFSYVDGCTGANINDGGFEQTIEDYITWSAIDSDEQIVDISFQTDSVYSGSVAAKLSAGKLCSNGSISTKFVMPLPSAGGGPALTFYAKYPAPQNTSLSVQMTTYGSQTEFFGGEMLGEFIELMQASVSSSDDWEQRTVCIDPNGAGRTGVLYFNLDGGGGLCATTYQTEEMWLDDIQLTTSPQCPNLNGL